MANYFDTYDSHISPFPELNIHLFSLLNWYGKHSKYISI